jgi:thiamine biosynthesis lipoprotein ApbE
VQRHTTSTEFVEWCAFLDLLWEKNHKWEYYLAAIMIKIEQAFASSESGASDLTVDDRLFKFKIGAEKTEDDLSQEEIEQEMAIQRATFEGVMARNKKRHEVLSAKPKKAVT